MSLNLEDKKAVVAEVAAQVAGAQTLVIAEYRGIAVSSMTKLRAKAREQGWSWQDIADALGVSRQAVHQKYHRGG